MRWRELVREDLEEWESIVDRVAKAEEREKVELCCRLVGGGMMMSRVEQRRELYSRGFTVEIVL